MSNPTQDFCSCGTACTCSPRVLRPETEPLVRAACCEDGRSTGQPTRCDCGC